MNNDYRSSRAIEAVVNRLLGPIVSIIFPNLVLFLFVKVFFPLYFIFVCRGEMFLQIIFSKKEIIALDMV